MSLSVMAETEKASVVEGWVMGITEEVEVDCRLKYLHCTQDCSSTQRGTRRPASNQNAHGYVGGIAATQMPRFKPQAANQASMRKKPRSTYESAGLSVLQTIWCVAAKIAVAVARNAIIILQVGRMCKAMLDARYPAQHSHMCLRKSEKKGE
jgi:hypothetical protein